MSTPPSWGIVSGGLLGLTLALRLNQSGRAVTVIEGAPAVGGLAAAWELPTPEGPVTWDRHYHVTLLSDASLQAVWRELGLEDELCWVETHTGYWYDERLHPLDTPIDFLRLPGLRLWDKARIGATILYGSRVRNPRRLERVPVEAWLRRWSGRRAVERLWLPLLRAKLGDNHRYALAAFQAPSLFRGPGYRLSPELLRLVGHRGYAYDASTLPTWIGPLARAYYFRSTTLSAADCLRLLADRFDVVPVGEHVRRLLHEGGPNRRRSAAAAPESAA